MDRFLLKVKIGYPSKKEEKEILERMTQPNLPQVQRVVTTHDILESRKMVAEVYMDEKIKNYILDLVFATREPESHKLPKLKVFIAYGASPRATLSLAWAAKAYAFLNGRGYVTPEDIQSIGMDVLRHRLLTTYEAEAENIGPEEILKTIFSTVEVP